MVYVKAASSHAFLAFRGAGLVAPLRLERAGLPMPGLELESSAANLIAKLAMVHAKLTGRLLLVARRVLKGPSFEPRQQ